ncbi:MAG: ABC transporter ATP-binding protein [Methylicorpusculum sp.]|uniref:ABC transporter ATP-binding protein n=1 Tax=Methylicorpusculum sp. TaxID=2713644 RepID=UPI0027250D19|nr:ABC transporter ATP-binding protein [Methylicorpusculum sp.]MDO8940091.1 ABC transporter ATP-binding protein [Methylicorpusculum sp.]MDP2202521.1 ABC transporter ATP-binding protein [Methylicorpusculum sp.]
MSAADIAIKVENLSKCYQIYDRPQDRLLQMLVRGRKQYFKEFWALKDVSFEIKKGETVGIIGRNGSGKSTLLQMICGTLNPTSGSIQTNGRIAALLELGSGFNPEFTGRENVYMNAAVLGLSKQEIEARYDDIVLFADIGEFIEQPVKTYSSGMFVRLAFAIQANVDPEILIVDEALAVGDAYFVHRCMLRFHQLQKNGTTILFVSHDALAVKTLCKRSLRFENGALINDDDSNTVVDSYLSSLFVSIHNKNQKPSKNLDRSLSTIKHHIDSALVGDLREGDQSLEIISVRLTGENGDRFDSINWFGNFKISIVVHNNSVQEGLTISVGYIVRDPRGIEIASTNTVYEGIDIRAPKCGSDLYIDFIVTLPMLNPGIYAITPSVSVVTLGTEFSIRDRIVNSLLLPVVADGPIYTPLRFPTTVVIF